ncbi:unnamed protein product [Prunus brigantina]
MTDAEWEDQNDLARRSIEQHLTDGVLCNAIKDTTNQSWEKLEELFESRSLSNKIFLKEELHYLKMEDGANMMEHVNAFNMCIADLQRMDEDDEGCFECGYKDYWKQNCLVWKEKRNKMKDAKSSGAANMSTSCDTDDELLTVMDEEHNGEVMAHSSSKMKSRQGMMGENVVGSVATEKMLLTKVIMEGTPRSVELDTRVEEDGYQQQTHKWVLLEVEPSSRAR